MAADHSLRWRQEALSQIHTPIQAALADAEFIHLAESPNPESGLWALAEWDDQLDPLTDRVEIAAVHFLQKNPACTLRDLETALNTELPGLLTPSLGQLRAVLASYAVETDGRWSLRPEDSPSARRDDLETASRTLDVLASGSDTRSNGMKKTRALYAGWKTGSPFTTLLCWPLRWWGVSCGKSPPRQVKTFSSSRVAAPACWPTSWSVTQP